MFKPLRCDCNCDSLVINKDLIKEFRMMREKIFDQMTSCYSNYGTDSEIDERNLMYVLFMNMKSDYLLEHYVTHEVAFKACFAKAEQTLKQTKEEKKC